PHRKRAPRGLPSQPRRSLEARGSTLLLLFTPTQIGTGGLQYCKRETTLEIGNRHRVAEVPPNLNNSVSDPRFRHWSETCPVARRLRYESRTMTKCESDGAHATRFNAGCGCVTSLLLLGAFNFADAAP